MHSDDLVIRVELPETLPSEIDLVVEDDRLQVRTPRHLLIYPLSKSSMDDLLGASASSFLKDKKSAVKAKWIEKDQMLELSIPQ